MFAKPFEHCESFMHSTAKDLLAKWLAEATQDNDRWQYPLVNGDLLAWRPSGPPVFVEYPFTEKGIGQTPVWDEVDRLWNLDEVTGCIVADAPTFENVTAAGFTPWAVADIALRHKGTISTVIEVAHKNPLTIEKAQFYRSIGVWQVFSIRADWVLKQIAKPEKLLLEVY